MKLMININCNRLTCGLCQYRTIEQDDGICFDAFCRLFDKEIGTTYNKIPRLQECLDAEAL